MKKSLLTIALLFTVILVSANNKYPGKNHPINTSKHITNVNSFCKLIQMGNYNVIKSLIEDGVDVNKKSTGLTPLMFAARHNKVAIVKLLIENGAKLRTKSDKGISVLKCAELSNAKDAYKIITTAIVEQKNKKRRNK